MNREIVPFSLYPVQGDVTSSAGNANVVVTGLRGISLPTTNPPVGSTIIFNTNTGTWDFITRACIQLNSIPISDDYEISVKSNHVTLNGTPIS